VEYQSATFGLPARIRNEAKTEAKSLDALRHAVRCPGDRIARTTAHKEQKPPWREDGFRSSGGGIRTRDLRVMRSIRLGWLGSDAAYLCGLGRRGFARVGSSRGHKRGHGRQPGFTATVALAGGPPPRASAYTEPRAPRRAMRARFRSGRRYLARRAKRRKVGLAGRSAFRERPLRTSLSARS
jgi:hypothetical protein